MSPSENATITAGSRVTLHFRLLLEDGTVAESSYEQQQPLSFVVGDGSLIENLETAITGLAAGDKQSVELPPENAFGFSEQDSIHTMQRSEFDASLTLEPGVVIGFDSPSGEQIPGTVVEVGADEVQVDFSHPLANRTITFEVEILAVEPPEQNTE